MLILKLLTTKTTIEKTLFKEIEIGFFKNTVCRELTYLCLLILFYYSLGKCLLTNPKTHIYVCMQ